jgi:hypothetical protein
VADPAAGVGVDQIPLREYRRLARWCDSIEGRFREAEFVILEGRRFFTEANFALLPYLPMDNKTRRALAGFRCEFLSGAARTACCLITIFRRHQKSAYWWFSAGFVASSLPGFMSPSISPLGVFIRPSQSTAPYWKDWIV